MKRLHSESCLCPTHTGTHSTQHKHNIDFHVTAVSVLYGVMHLTLFNLFNDQSNTCHISPQNQNQFLHKEQCNTVFITNPHYRIANTCIFLLKSV